MKFIENTLERLDNYFEEKKDTEFYLIIFMIVAAFGYLSYGLLIPMTDKMLKKDMATKRSLEGQIRSYESYLRSITVNGDRRYKIKKLQKEIAQLKTGYKDLKELNEYFDYQIMTLSEMLFNEKNWAKFLDSLTEEAKKHHVKIAMISNKFVDNTKNFGHVLEIGIDCSGKYKDMVAYLNAIEESDLVVDVYEIVMESEKTITASLKVSVWGINY
jgi:hypothetical protein